jgi:hypothetical protein
MKKYVLALIIAVIVSLVAYFMMMGKHEKVMSRIDLQMVRPLPSGDADRPDVVHTDTIRRGTRNHMILFTFFGDVKKRSWLSGRSSELRKDKLKEIGLFVYDRGHWTALTRYISKGPSFSYDQYLNIDSNYGSLDEFLHAYNYAFSNETDVHTSDLGERGISYVLNIPGASDLSGRHVLRLEFVFDSGRKLEKEATYVIL